MPEFSDLPIEVSSDRHTGRPRESKASLLLLLLVRTFRLFNDKVTLAGGACRGFKLENHIGPWLVDQSHHCRRLTREIQN